MPVIAALKLDYLVTSGEATGSPYRAHDRFRAGVNQAQHLHRRKVLPDKPGKLYLSLVAGSESKPAVARGLNSPGYLRDCVPEYIRSPGADVVDEFVSVLVVYFRALRTFDEQRGNSYRTACAHRAVHPARHEFTCFFIQLFGICGVHLCSSFSHSAASRA